MKLCPIGHLANLVPLKLIQFDDPVLYLALTISLLLCHSSDMLSCPSFLSPIKTCVILLLMPFVLYFFCILLLICYNLDLGSCKMFVFFIHCGWQTACQTVKVHKLCDQCPHVFVVMAHILSMTCLKYNFSASFLSIFFQALKICQSLILWFYVDFIKYVSWLETIKLKIVLIFCSIFLFILSLAFLLTCTFRLYILKNVNMTLGRQKGAMNHDKVVLYLFSQLRLEFWL